jgi:hypothetical protein
MKRLLLTAVLLAAGCASSPTVKLYDGPDRRSGELATVTLPYQVEMADINGTALPWRSGFQATHEQSYELLPGRYAFRFRFNSPYEFGGDRPGVATPRMERTANLEGGHNYRFKTKVEGDSGTADVMVWIVDESSGQPVDEQTPADGASPSDKHRPIAPEPVAPKPIPPPVAIAPFPVEETAATNVETKAVAEPAPAPAVEPEPQPVAENAPPPAVKSSTLNDLQSRWEKASPEEREEFLKQLIEK